MSEAFRIELPKQKIHNPLRKSMAEQGVRKQVMRDRRLKRAKDARKSWQREYQDNG